MIVELTVENLAIIERAELQMGPGFTALSGETGAGKSLLIDAIELAMGERADTELVRTGAPKASVQVVFDLSSQPTLREKCAEFGLDLTENLLFVQREVMSEGRSVARLNGKTCPVGTLRALGPLLVDLHGQHEHQALLDPVRHLAYLDAWIGPELAPLLSAVADRLVAYRAAHQALRAFRSNIRDREHKLDLLRFQVKEIETVSPVAGEYEELESALQRLKYSEKLAEGVFAALSAIADAEVNAHDQLGHGARSLQSLLKFDEALQAPLDRLTAAMAELDEAIAYLRDYAESLDADPGRLDEVTERMDALKRLRRKYGENEAAILEFLIKAQNELALLEDAEASEDSLLDAEKKARAELRAACAKVTALRLAKGIDFAEIVADQLRDLGMERAKFDVQRTDKDPDETGADELIFLFSANAGEDPKPLNKIASGGEMSRVMLAIKTALAGRAGVPTLIFDEVDAGLGGRTAAIVARKLAELATHYQVLVISHSPQIASRATTHFRISKAESNGRVTTRIVGLQPKEREEEIARMLAGEHVTESALANARELLGL